MSLGRRGGSCQLSVISDQLSVGAENRRAGIRDAWGERRREGLGRNPWVVRTQSFSGVGWALACVCDSGLKGQFLVAQGAAVGEGLRCSGGKPSQTPDFVFNDAG